MVEVVVEATFARVNTRVAENCSKNRNSINLNVKTIKNSNDCLNFLGIMADF